MKPVLIALLLLLLLPDGAFSGRTPWRSTRVVVNDYTSAAWDGILPQTVAQMNAMLPPEAPRLVYRRRQTRACSHVPPRRGTIAVCSADPLRAHGVTKVWLSKKQTATKARVRLSDARIRSRRDARNTACHELMHALTGIRDNPGAAPATSCVWGTRPTPGRRDRAFAAQVYARDGEREPRGPRRQASGSGHERRRTLAARGDT
jgi:hypothetical protein